MRVTAQSRLRVFLLCLAMLCSSLGLMVFGPVAPAKADPPCMTNGGVYAIFVRGSGESIDDKREVAFKTSILSLLASYGVPRAWAEIGNLANYNPSGQNPVEALAYKAVDWRDWRIFSDMDGYYNSVGMGTTELFL